MAFDEPLILIETDDEALILIETEQPDVLIVQEPPPAEIVLVMAEQGLPGPPGGELLRDYTAAQTLGGHRAVALVAPGTVDVADVRNVAHCNRVVGITTGAVAAGAKAEIRARGQMSEPGWVWLPGRDVFLGADGLLTQTLGLAGALFVQRLGCALSPAEILVDLGEPILFED